MKKRPLEGKKVVVTRPQEQSDSFREALEARGAKVILFPTIEIRAVRDVALRGEIERALEQLAEYRWVIFTSVNGVDCFVEAIGSNAQAKAALKKARIAVIGEKTAERLLTKGFQASLCPQEYRAEGVLEALLGADRAALEKGARVLLARALKARDVLPDGLREVGARLDVVSVYETTTSRAPTQELVKALEDQAVDCLTFTSSSTVTSFFEKLSGHPIADLLKKPVIASLGPITGQTLSELGYRPQIEAMPYTTEALAQAIEKFFREANHE